MWHIALHFIVPLAVALAFYRERWKNTTLILLATLLVDADHLLATPVYDPDRCSIGFHPLHAPGAIIAYLALFALPLVLARRPGPRPAWERIAHLAGLGLLIHMALDGLDCVV